MYVYAYIYIHDPIILHLIHVFYMLFVVILIIIWNSVQKKTKCNPKKTCFQKIFHLVQMYF